MQYEKITGKGRSRDVPTAYTSASRMWNSTW